MLASGPCVSDVIYVLDRLLPDAPSDSPLESFEPESPLLHIDFYTLPQPHRLSFYTFFLHFFENYPDVHLIPMSVRDRWVETLLRQFQGEKDPRNLIPHFSLFACLLERDWLAISDSATDLSSDSNARSVDRLMEDLFQILFCYYPITFTPPIDDPFKVSPDSLRQALDKALLAFVNKCPARILNYTVWVNLMDKLQGSSTATAPNIIRTFGMLISRPNMKDIVISQHSSLVEALFDEIWTARSTCIITEAIKTIMAIIRSLKCPSPSLNDRRKELELDIVEIISPVLLKAINFLELESSLDDEFNPLTRLRDEQSLQMILRSLVKDIDDVLLTEYIYENLGVFILNSWKMIKSSSTEVQSSKLSNLPFGVSLVSIIFRTSPTPSFLREAAVDTLDTLLSFLDFDVEGLVAFDFLELISTLLMISHSSLSKEKFSCVIAKLNHHLFDIFSTNFYEMSIQCAIIDFYATLSESTSIISQFLMHLVTLMIQADRGHIVVWEKFFGLFLQQIALLREADVFGGLLLKLLHSFQNLAESLALEGPSLTGSTCPDSLWIFARVLGNLPHSTFIHLNGLSAKKDIVSQLETTVNTFSKLINQDDDTLVAASHFGNFCWSLYSTCDPEVLQCHIPQDNDKGRIFERSYVLKARIFSFILARELANPSSCATQSPLQQILASIPSNALLDDISFAHFRAGGYFFFFCKDSCAELLPQDRSRGLKAVYTGLWHVRLRLSQGNILPETTRKVKRLFEYIDSMDLFSLLYEESVDVIDFVLASADLDSKKTPDFPLRAFWKDSNSKLFKQKQFFMVLDVLDELQKKYHGRNAYVNEWLAKFIQCADASFIDSVLNSRLKGLIMMILREPISTADDACLDFEFYEVFVELVARLADLNRESFPEGQGLARELILLLLPYMRYEPGTSINVKTRLVILNVVKTLSTKIDGKKWLIEQLETCLADPKRIFREAVRKLVNQLYLENEG